MKKHIKTALAASLFFVALFNANISLDIKGNGTAALSSLSFTTMASAESTPCWNNCCWGWGTSCASSTCCDGYFWAW
ncbi:MAG: hypothetical protein KA313_06675 [Pseudarcicella sp.]|nr:hypothetical protein [Pseudarcicella sp.]MBP6410765.1 hypothetical protein [Pseudarcicella sp.]